MAKQYVPGGRRIMPPSERDALKRDELHTCDRAIGAEESLHLAGKNAGGLVPIIKSDGQPDKVLIVYTRYWSVPAWRFSVEARGVFGDILTSATSETNAEARE